MRQKTAKTFPCSSNSKLLLETFKIIDVTQDDSDTHPSWRISADKKVVPYSTHATHNLYQCCRHREGECKKNFILLITLGRALDPHADGARLNDFTD